MYKLLAVSNNPWEFPVKLNKGYIVCLTRYVISYRFVLCHRIIMQFSSYKTSFLINSNDACRSIIFYEKLTPRKLP